ncbi:unnamed protein product [Adineta steineri]|uniref:Uncharacterized protein n=1 Tax=Adineta steineri TaxID=433720 RepID=A0A813MS15_9BILA|nr:unnamed protein product [Adineta steineri]
MVSLFNITLVGLLLIFVAIIQATPVPETSNDVNEHKSPISNQQLYEFYKIIREDPRYAMVSNKDIVAYIYRNLILGNGDQTNFVKPKEQKRPQQRHQKIVQNE